MSPISEIPPGDSFHNYKVNDCPNPEIHGNPFRYCACG